MDLLTLCSCCGIGTVLIFAVALVLGQKRMRQVELVMRQLAERHRASFTPGNLFYNPFIAFPQGDLELRLYAALGGRDDPSHTEARAWLPEPPLGAPQPPGAPAPAALRIRPHSFSTRLTVTLGASPYLTGDQEFDAAFDVRGRPEALLRGCLTPEVRQCLLGLKANRPALRLGLKRRLLPERAAQVPQQPAGGITGSLPSQPPGPRLGQTAMQYTFYTAGLPAEAEAWEPRIAAARLLLAQVLEQLP